MVTFYSTSYILHTKAHNNPTSVAFKRCAPFIKCITKLDGITIDDAEELDLVMLIWNLRGNSSNYGYNYGFFLKMKQLILMQILQTLSISNLWSIKPNYWKTQLQTEMIQF